MADLTEYRIMLPVSLAELEIASRYTVCTMDKAETGGGEGAEYVVVSEKSDYQGEEAVYCHKFVHLASKVPSMIRMLAPTGSLEVHAKSWKTFPKCRTEVTNPDYMKDGFHHVVDTTCKEGDKGDIDNIFDLSAEKLSTRQVDVIDFVNDQVDPRDYSEETDPTKVKVEKLNRGPLTADWKASQSPVVCLYKLVETEFKWFGMQAKAQSMIKKTTRRYFLNFYRMMYSNLDKCHGMTIEDVLAFEQETKAELDQLRLTGEVRGMSEK